MSSKRFFKKSKKNTPASKSKKQSPSISRTIPASTKLSFPKITLARIVKLYSGSLKIVVATLFILAVAIVGLDLQKNIQEKQSIDIEREKLAQELKFWNDFIGEHEDYADAYFNIAVLEYKLGDTAQAKTYLKKGLVLDPNSENGKKIEDSLSR